jgi:REP element-mobilizing transposase RayT
MTHRGQAWFKIAAAARFCEHAVRHACNALGWMLEVVVVLPDRVQILLVAPAREDRRAISHRLREVTTRLLMDANVVPRGVEHVWDDDGWCAVLPSAVAHAAVRRVLRERKARYDPVRAEPPGDRPG